MRRLLARVRGLMGLVGIGAVGGAVLGALWESIAGLLAFGDVYGAGVTRSTALWASFGALTGGGFGVMLIAVGSTRSLEKITTWRAGLLGATAGVLVPVVSLSLLNRSFPPVLSMLPFLGFCAGLGALMGSSLVAIAKRAPSGELESGDRRQIPRPDRRI